MPIPSFPKNLFTRIFASDGTYRVIPDTKAGTGRASLSLGFPNETQLPLSHGGIAPNRMDFNGMFYMLSAFAFWQQSGGIAMYNASLNYTQPNMVYYNGVIYWCMADNGPGISSVGAVRPGTDEKYWKEFLKALGVDKDAVTSAINSLQKLVVVSKDKGNSLSAGKDGGAYYTAPVLPENRGSMIPAGAKVVPWAFFRPAGSSRRLYWNSGFPERIKHELFRVPGSIDYILFSTTPWGRIAYPTWNGETWTFEWEDYGGITDRYAETNDGTSLGSGPEDGVLLIYYTTKK